MAMGDISNDELLLTGVPADALGDEQVDEDLPSEGTGNKEPEISKYIQLSELFKRRRSCVSSRRQKVVLYYCIRLLLIRSGSLSRKSSPVLCSRDEDYTMWRDNHCRL